MLESLTTIIPFLEPYPVWVKILVASWIALTAVLAIALLFGKPRSPASALGLESPKQGTEIPTTGQTGEGSVSQTMFNSPGSIQAGRDVIIAADRRLIRSIRLHITIETETAVAPVSDPQTDVGLGSAIALFTRDNARIRFVSDFRIVDHQRAPNRRRLSFVYEPENPIEILGKPIEFLASIGVLAVNYAEIFQTERFDTKTGSTEFYCSAIVNGIPIAEIRAGIQPAGTLNQGQASLQVAGVFSKIPDAYGAPVSR